MGEEVPELVSRGGFERWGDRILKVVSYIVDGERTRFVEEFGRGRGN